jgi:hypothetical protein
MRYEEFETAAKLVEYVQVRLSSGSQDSECAY